MTILNYPNDTVAPRYEPAAMAYIAGAIAQILLYVVDLPVEIEGPARVLIMAAALLITRKAVAPLTKLSDGLWTADVVAAIEQGQEARNGNTDPQ